jgi:two-component system chemotaxis response regulator CheB
MVSDVLSTDRDVEVVGVASNGRLAIAKIPQISPDVITLDVEMPEMDGLTTLTEIRKTHPRLPVFMFSSRTEPAAEATVEALLRGATDYVTKPTSGDGAAVIRTELLPKLKESCQGIIVHSPPVSSSLNKTPTLVPVSKSRFQEPAPRPAILAIGVSTGGPNALSRVFSDLPANLGVPIVLVQHMPPMFTRILAERLSANSGMVVREASEGDILEPGRAYVAPGGKHMVVAREGVQVVMHLNEDPPENSCRPAVDVLFRSVAAVFGRETLAIVMTGMGQDGLRGAQEIFDQGGRIWAQDEGSSVVWGMPGSIVRGQLAEKVLPLKELGNEIGQRIGISHHTMALRRGK